MPKSPWSHMLPLLWRDRRGRCFFCRRRTLMWRDARDILGARNLGGKLLSIPGRKPGFYAVATVEHLKRRTDGGSAVGWNNCVMACGPCNGRRNKACQPKRKRLRGGIGR